MRVGLPIEQFWHRIPGGTGRATRETMAAMAAMAAGSTPFEARPLAAWHRPSRRCPALLEELDLGRPVRFVPLPRPLLYEAWLRWDRPRLEPWTGPVDVVWASAMVMVPSRAPVVATVHDLGFLDHPERSSRRGRAFFPRAWAAVLDRAALVVCPSQVVADDCVRHGLDPALTRVVPWGVAPPLSAPPDAELVRRRYGLPARFVLWVGTLEPRKNLPGLVEAVRRLDGVALAVVGPSGWNLDGTDVLAPLGDRVHRLGPVDDRTLSALYRAASVFVLPSFLEGFGLPVLEALAHGTPVVTSAGTATAEVAGDAARLVDPRDPAALAEAIAAALSGDGITARLVAAGRDRARALSWQATAEGYLALLRAAAGERVGGERGQG